MAIPREPDSIESDPTEADPSVRRRRRSDDIATNVARGMADGFTEASQAFANELEDTTGCTDLLERSISGFLRANGRFLDELASVVRRTADDLGGAGRRGAPDSIDYEYLADLVAARLRADPTITS